VIRTSLFISVTVLLVVAFALMSRLDFLASSTKTLLVHCGGTIALFLGVLGVNLFAATLAINRKILLKDTGRKLTHFDNQLQAESPEGLPPFLTERR
jgi:hypothetical protein